MPQQEITYLTAEGAERLRQELDFLKGPKREELARRLRAAIQQGDLSENADYISTKEEQAFIEGRVLELEHALKNVIIIDEIKKDTTTVNVGARVTVQEGNFDPETYFLVGPKEANPINGQISYESPIGQALIGSRVGDHVNAQTPTGIVRLKVIAIE